MQNIPYVRTAADLERKYNLSALPTIEKNTKTNQEQILKTNTILEEFTAETIKNLENLQNQVDGNITTYYYSGVPTLLNPPVSDWKEEEYNVHLGDLYYDKDTGYAYRFYLDTETNVYGWVRITDSDITEALAIANTAQDTADAKRRVFVVEPKPPYDVGDIWFKEDKDLFRCKLGRQKGDNFNNSDWILATNYTDDTAANEAKAELSDYKVYVATTYETQADFIKEKEALELKVSKVETVANDKNKVFTSEPTTPYLPGDVYIKETTIDGMKQNLIYVCQTGRESGDYNPNDFSLQPSYASQSDLKIETNKIESSLNQKVSNEELDTTLEELSNSITQEINNKENSILLKVSNDYSTKNETNQAKNEAINSANSSTDSKLTNYATNESVNASLALKVGKDENNQIVSMLNASANEINIKGDRFVLDSTNFKVDKTGNITAKNGKFTGGELFLDDSGGEDASITIRDNIGYSTLPIIGQDISGKTIALKQITTSVSSTELPELNDILLETENGWGIKVNYISSIGDGTIAIILYYYDGSTNCKFASILAQADGEGLYEFTIADSSNIAVPSNAGIVTITGNSVLSRLIILYNIGELNKLSKYSSSGFESDIYSAYSPKGVLYTKQDVDDLINLIIEIRNSGRQPTTEELAKYDLNNDGVLDSSDLARMQKVIIEGASIQQPAHLSINTAISEEFGATGKIISLKDGWGKDRVNIGLNGIESQGGNLYYRDGDTYELTSFVGGGYVTGSGKGFNLGTLFTPKSLANINSVTLNAGGKLTVRQGGKYLVGSANGGATMSLKYCYAQKMGDNAIGIFYNAPSAPSGVVNNDAIGVIISDLSITLNGYAEETAMASIVD